jgi:hypothetical protein
MAGAKDRIARTAQEAGGRLTGDTAREGQGTSSAKLRTR